MEHILALTPEPDEAAVATADEAAGTARIRAFKAAPLVLSRHLEAGAAFQTIIGAALAHFLGNTPAVRAGEPEGVHQARLALRRLRAALALFAPLLRAPASEPTAAALRRVGQAFGAARDWDVFRLETLPRAAAECLEPRAATALAAAAERKRRKAHAEAVAELDGAAMAGVVATLGAWASGPRAHLLAGGSSAMLIAELAPDLLGRLAHKVAKRRKQVDHHAGEQLHALRKAVKKLRYGGEDLASLYQRKRTRPYLRTCRHLSDVLGGINDGDVAVRLAAAAQPPGGPLAPAMAALRHWSEARQAPALGQFDQAWEEFASAKPFWT